MRPLRSAEWRDLPDIGVAHKVWVIAVDPVAKDGREELFRQVGIDPEGAANFGYVFLNFVVMDLRLRSGWRSSLGW